MAEHATFGERAGPALADERLRAALRRATDTLAPNRARGLAGLDDSDGLRDAARAVRLRTLARLPELLEQWADAFEARGGTVCWARTAEEAVDYVRELARRHGAGTVVKGKSMASEEIHLNPALEADGRRVVETDLGELIIQLADEPPSHILAPAIHKDRHDVAELFSRVGGEPVEADPKVEAAWARQRLRQDFLAAGLGVTGVNFAVAEAGSICLVENEGNGRMCSSLPPVHVAVMGMERLVATWAELDLMLALLARSATGQALSVYTNVLTGPRRAGEADGPGELHVVVLDNGRSEALGSEFHEVLSCIRCGACLNACPVYRQVGGHAYGSVYSGPIGAVLTPLLRRGEPPARELSEASSLCGACWEACPVRIPLHDLLLRLRRRDAPGDASRLRRLGFAAWSWAWSTRPGFAASLVAGRLALRAGRHRRAAPGWAGAWLRTRDAPEVRRR